MRSCTVSSEVGAFLPLLVVPQHRAYGWMELTCARTEEEEIAEMPVELYMLDKLKARIQLAREIDSVQHKAKKEKHERNWLKEAADAMEIELDSDLARYGLLLVAC